MFCKINIMYALISRLFYFSLPYLSYFGGVTAFTPDQFWKVNGYSNLYFGWGGEDDDIVTRLLHVSTICFCKYRS